MRDPIMRCPDRLGAVALYLIRRVGRCPGVLTMQRTAKPPRMWMPYTSHRDCCSASYALFYRAMNALKSSVRAGDASRPGRAGQPHGGDSPLR